MDTLRLENLVELEDPLYGVPSVYVPMYAQLLQEGITTFFKKRPDMRDFYSPEWIVTAIMERNMQLWLVCKDDEVKGFLITQIVIYPCTKALEVFLTYGRFGTELRQEIYEKIHLYAQYHKCRKIIGYGRKGWLRAFGKGMVKENSQFISEVPHEKTALH